MDLERLRRAETVVRRFFPPTPILFARRLTRIFGREIFLKLDAFTPIRAFKLRGALVKLHALEDAGVKGGVATASGGNHGLAVAWAARALGRPALVVVPESANPQKVQAIEDEGAEVLRFGLDYQAAADEALGLAGARGFTYVHAYDDLDVIAGQGTLGLELPPCHTFLCGVGGGGLIAGVASALKARPEPPRVFGVQPKGADSLARSLEAGKLVELSRVDTAADGLGARRPGAHVFDLARQHVDQVLRVSDEDLWRAAGLLLREERIVAEMAGVAGLAGLMRQPEVAEGRVIVAITGANVSDEFHRRLLAGDPLQGA